MLCPYICEYAKTNANAAWHSELGVDVDGNGVPLLDVERKLSVRTNGNSRSGAASATLGTIDHVAICSSREARLETRVPILIRVVDRHKPSVSTSKCDKLRTRGDPVRQPVRLNSVPESDHPGNGGPTMLAVPSVGSAVSVTGTVVPVRSALIVVAELVTGKDRGSAPWMSQDPDVSEGIDIVRRVSVQGIAIAFRIVVGDESVGTTAGAGGVAVGFGVLERGDSAILECGLEGESVLESFSLTESSVFSGGDAWSSTIVDLKQIAMSKRSVSHDELGSYFLGNVAGLHRELIEDGLNITCGHV
jgi:hypothetical protein